MSEIPWATITWCSQCGHKARTSGCACAGGGNLCPCPCAPAEEADGTKAVRASMWDHTDHERYVAARTACAARAADAARRAKWAAEAVRDDVRYAADAALSFAVEGLSADGLEWIGRKVPDEQAFADRDAANAAADAIYAAAVAAADAEHQRVETALETAGTLQDVLAIGYHHVGGPS
jgi:hypothetical protein